MRDGQVPIERPMNKFTQACDNVRWQTLKLALLQPLMANEGSKFLLIIVAL